MCHPPPSSQGGKAHAQPRWHLGDRNGLKFWIWLPLHPSWAPGWLRLNPFNIIKSPVSLAQIVKHCKFFHSNGFEPIWASYWASLKRCISLRFFHSNVFEPIWAPYWAWLKCEKLLRLFHSNVFEPTWASYWAWLRSPEGSWGSPGTLNLIIWVCYES